MKRKLLFVMTLAFVMILGACGTGDEGGNSEGGDNTGGGGEQALVFGTGGTSGTYYPIGGALKPIFEESEHVSNVTVESTGASVANIQNIEDGLNQLAIVMSDVAYDAVNGVGKFEGNQIDIQAIGGLYQNVVQVIALKDSGIQDITDLKGKRVGVGKVGSGVEQSAKKVLEAMGMTYDDLAKVTHTGYADSVQEMKNGNLDAAFFTSGVPNSNITDIMQQTDIVFVEIKGEVADQLLESYPFYKKYTIPAGDEVKYNLDTPVETVGIQNMLIASPDLSEDLVYDITKRFYDYLGSDEISINALTQFDRDEMGNGLVAPLHPGAQKFYEENGLLD
ncbi:MAG: TAXI family TRAP transporter solute-binding subunit [Bacillaceae bacterium]|nr:TAXI family TRAP transporter solute-binding subunit [Bacillaceae bacterium]